MKKKYFFLVFFILHFFISCQNIDSIQSWKKGKEYLKNAIETGRLNDFNFAIQEFNIAIHRNPKRAENYIDLGKAYFWKARNTHYRHLLNRKSFKDSIFITLYDSSLKNIDKAIELDPNNAIWPYKRAFIFYRLGKVDLALSDIKKVIYLKPESWQPYLLRAIISLEKGEENRSLSDLESVINFRSKKGIFACESPDDVINYSCVELTSEINTNIVKASYWIDLLTPHNDELSIISEGALYWMRPKCVEPLLQEMVHQGPSLQILGLFIKMGEEVIEPLINFLDDEEKGTHCSSILTAIGDSAIPSLIKVLNDDNKAPLASASLVRIGNSSIPRLVSCLDDSTRANQAAFALANIGESSIEPLISILDDHEKSSAASIALVMIGKPAIDPLISLLEDPYKQKEARIALALMGVITLEPLVLSLADQSKVKSAMNALCMIGIDVIYNIRDRELLENIVKDITKETDIIIKSETANLYKNKNYKSDTQIDFQIHKIISNNERIESEKINRIINALIHVTEIITNSHSNKFSSQEINEIKENIQSIMFGEMITLQATRWKERVNQQRTDLNDLKRELQARAQQKDILEKGIAILKLQTIKFIEEAENSFIEQESTLNTILNRLSKDPNYKKVDLLIEERRKFQIASEVTRNEFERMKKYIRDTDYPADPEYMEKWLKGMYKYGFRHPPSKINKISSLIEIPKNLKYLSSGYESKAIIYDKEGNILIPGILFYLEWSKRLIPKNH